MYEWYILPTEEVFYVGKGSGKRYKSISSRNKFFKDMYNTHQCNVRKVKDGLSEKEAFDYEKYLIKYYRDNTDYRLTNITDGGDGASGMWMTDETRAKMSEASKKKWQDEMWKQKVIANRHLPTSTYQSEEFKNKISILVTGEKNPNYQHYWTEEQKQHLRDKQIASGRYTGARNPSAKRIKCVETGEEFECIKYACDKYGIKYPSSITICLDKPNRTAKGMHFIQL